MGGSQGKQDSAGKWEEDVTKERNQTLPRKAPGLKSRLSNLKTGSLKRSTTLNSKNQLTPAEIAMLNGKKWRSECSLNHEYGGRRKERQQGPVTEEDLQLVPARVEEIPEDERGSCIVNLLKKDGSVMGLTLSGGADKEGRPRVSNLRSTGIAAKSDKLQVGDFITAVNGIRTSKLKHGEIISLLKNIGEKVSLEIDYRLPPTTVQTTSIIQKTADIFVKKVDDSFGFVLRGGGNEEYRKSRPLVVTHLRPDSPADKEGSLKTGDRILAIGTTKLSSLCLEESLNHLEHCGDEAVFTIEYDVSVVEAVANASGPLLIEVSNTPGTDLGITLAKSTYRKKPVLVIDRVKPASISDRCGALHVGDQILSIDNVSVQSGAVSLREASEMLSSASDFVKLEILPVSHLAIASAKSASLNRFAPVITSTQSMIALNPERMGGSRYYSGNTFSRHGRAGNRMQRKRMRPKHSASATHSSTTAIEGDGLASEIFRSLKSDGYMSLVSTDYLSGNQVVHTEVIEVTLLTADDGCDLVTSAAALPNFGIQLQGGVFATELLNSVPLIGFIEPDRVADRCGLLQAGDRILSINGYSCEECTIDEVDQHISEAYYSGQARFEIEFDVAESVVPSSGTFHAKLPKRRGVDLGIVVNAPSGQQFNRTLMISEVKCGSVAHRTGTLEAGDRLLAIDGVRLDDCTVEDAHALLASAEDVVRLKIQKDEENSDEAESSNAISYTVELKRRGGPLGITISGTEEPFDPIVISGLTSGGLADRTGAIHEGDKIQSINGKSLRAKPLSEAITLLRNAGEVVTLKIKRQLTKYEEKSPTSAPTTSPFAVDSTKRISAVKNDVVSELSDPEDDILPPPMGPISDHPPFSDPTNTSKPGNLTTVLSKDRGVRPGPAGAPSVDSEVGSWDGFSGEMHRTRSNNGSNQQTGISPIHKEATSFVHFQNFTGNAVSQARKQPQTYSYGKIKGRNESGIEHARSRFETNSSRTYSDTWGTREQILARNMKSPERGRVAPVADWQRALEDLQSVGQATGYLRDLETKLTLDGDEGNKRADTYRRQPYGDGHNYQKLPHDGGFYNTLGNRQEYNRNAQRRVPMKFHKLTLYKDNPSEDFGFSMSDGQLDRGVYVHSVRPNSAAEIAGLLPYDRLLQINGTSTHNADCSVAIPLVACAQMRMEVLVSRNPSNSANMMTYYEGQPFLSTPRNPSNQNLLPSDVYPTL